MQSILIKKEARYFSLRRTRGKGEKQKEKGWMKSNHVFSRKPDLCENPKAELPPRSFAPRRQCILDWP